MNTQKTEDNIPQKKTLLLVDGSSYLYRAFHALPDLRNRENEPTGALYGVLNMLRRLHKEFKSDYSACVFDAKGKTFRDEWYPEYKAHRPPMPQDLSYQIEPLLDAIRAMGWPMVTVEGVEADDVIGTLCVKARGAGMQAIVSTGDKDMAQLVNSDVFLVNTMSNEMLDEGGVLNKFGVPPSLILDYLTLVGDVVDNVPGVEKVGPKTAVKWINQYGSLDNVMSHAEEVTGVVGENLRKARDWLPQAKRLLTIRCDLDLPFSWQDLSQKPQDREKLIELYTRYEFKTWLKELESEKESVEMEKQYEILLHEEQFDKWLAKINAAERVCLIAKASSSEPMTASLAGMAFSIEEAHAAYLPLGHNYSEQLGIEAALLRLKPWLESEKKVKVGHDLKFASHIFANHGINLAGHSHDTLLESYVVESHKPHDIQSLCLQHLGLRMIPYADVAGKGAGEIGFSRIDMEKAAEYACLEADMVLRIHRHLISEMERDSGLSFVYGKIEIPSLHALYKMERNGVLIDSKKLQKHSHDLGGKMLSLEQQAFDIAGQPFNLNSPKQIQEILFDKLKLPVIKKTPSGGPSTDEEVLQELSLDYPLPKILLEYRSLAKLKSTYADKLPRMVNARTGRVHTHYSQAVAVTGRIASSSPNLQNIPIRSEEGRKIREAFIASPGCHLISADYSQIELRIMAHISRDEGLLKAFSKGEDIHRRTAAEIFGLSPEEISSEQRRYAKVINFGLIYGMSSFGLASELGVERSAAQAYIDRYFARYPGVADYMKRTREEAKKNGYVETVFGRRLWLAEINSPNGLRRAGAERAAINAPMQGTAADLIKLAMISVQNRLDSENYGSRLIMQVHDELVLEVPDRELAEIKVLVPELMSKVAALSVPLVVDCGVGLNWDEAH